MKQRLVWNFELSTKKSVLSNDFSTVDNDEIKWEMRLFWTEKEIIILNCIDLAMQDLANYTIKSKDDFYYLLPGKNYNIKQRRGKLLYKPLVKEKNTALGFAVKIDLESESEHSPLAREILQQLKKTGVKIPVKKTSFTYKFATKPSVKLELARLLVDEQVFFSLCVEGKSLHLVQCISKSLIGTQNSCDYVSFLKSIHSYD